jgi:hypothetical protein
VNDAPSFDLISDTVSVLEDFPLYVQQAAINVSAGAANEAFQCLTFVVSNCSDELLLYFDIVPHLHANGTLVFKTAHNAAGFIVCNVSLVDCLGASSNGSFASSFKALGFQVTAVNDAPTATITPATYAATEQVALTLHGTGLSIADVDAGAAARWLGRTLGAPPEILRPNPPNTRETTNQE